MLISASSVVIKSALGHELPSRLRWRHDWSAPDSRRLTALSKSAGSGQKQTLLQAQGPRAVGAGLQCMQVQ